MHGVGEKGVSRRSGELISQWRLMLIYEFSETCAGGPTRGVLTDRIMTIDTLLRLSTMMVLAPHRALLAGRLFLFLAGLALSSVSSSEGNVTTLSLQSISSIDRSTLGLAAWGTNQDRFSRIYSYTVQAPCVLSIQQPGRRCREPAAHLLRQPPAEAGARRVG